LRIGLNYARGLRRISIEDLIASRVAAGSFASVDDLAKRVPSLNRKDMVSLAHIGALNELADVAHRRDALWQVEDAARTPGPLLRTIAPSRQRVSPLSAMTTEERLIADYAGAGLTTGPHPMAYHRAALRAEGAYAATELLRCANNLDVRVAGCVIARQRPGTAKGFVFLSLEDETGIANIILTPDVFERDRLLVTRHRFLLIGGRLQNNDGVVHVKAYRIAPLEITEASTSSHDFH
jgi:error-prone DNA polymerase